MNRSPIKPRNPKRRAKLYVVQYDGGIGHDEWIRQQPCSACGRDDQIHAAHVRSRGAGGTARDLIPLCVWDHQEQHQHGWLPDDEDKRGSHKWRNGMTFEDALALAHSMWDWHEEQMSG